ncbi:nitrilase-related carbon-nitrogen hydrolase [Aestuariimicrobium ganziense]|uniref:nitrilase-related carbon-nitrogen hydrolase n=1 Tax=Aestuariimicrobium ganziense TaxID=2773677 RepID=UPI001942D41A|nr:nitrilase-related carbon-nitrogen hydrolase [Aestuariimicrobium ganziense]
MTRTLSVAALQWRTTDDPTVNLAALTARARVAVDQGAQIAVAPEAALACYGSDLRALAQPLDGPFVTGLRELASDLGTWLVAGTFVPAGDRVRNTAVLTNGDALHHYAKIHLYDAFGARESDLVEPGTDLVHADLPLAGGVRVGLAICYDLRFADQFTAFGRAGCALVCVPTAWGVGPGKIEQLQVLTRARAMDAQSFVVVADQSGGPQPTADPLGVGHSAVTGPLGEVVGELDDQPGVLVRAIDLGEVDEVRARVPIGVPPVGS